VKPEIPPRGKRGTVVSDGPSVEKGGKRKGPLSAWNAILPVYKNVFEQVVP